MCARSSGPVPFLFTCCCSLVVERREGVWNVPTANMAKIMTLWLCLSFAALCLSLKSNSVNTHSDGTVAQLWAVCVPPQSFSWNIQKLHWSGPPVSPACILSLYCCFQCNLRTFERVWVPCLLQLCKRWGKIKWRAGCKQLRVCAKFLLLLARNDIISPRGCEQSLWTITPKYVISAAAACSDSTRPTAQLILIKYLQHTNSLEFLHVIMMQNETLFEVIAPNKH